MKRRRVVITGLGVVSPVGIGKEQFWESLVQGRSGIDRITAFDPSGFPSQIAGEVKGFVPEDYISSRQVGRMSRFSQFAVAAAKMAVADAGLEIEPEAERIGVCFGTSIGGGGTVAEETHRDFMAKGVEGVHAWAAAEFSPHAPTSHVSIELGIKGISTTISSACATGLDVINWGCLQICSGASDAIVAGSCDAPFSPLNFSALCASNNLSKRNTAPREASRPYDVLRDGIVVSEGAGAVILESLEHALAREGRIYTEVTG
ncbi:MAG: beta-ketoacyl-[acyl-carrier-protein] synthase II, partial [Thermoplasmata archaeon]